VPLAFVTGTLAMRHRPHPQFLARPHPLMAGAHMMPDCAGGASPSFRSFRSASFRGQTCMAAGLRPAT